MSSVGQAMLEAASFVRSTQNSLKEKDVEEIVTAMISQPSFTKDPTDPVNDLGRFVEKDGDRMYSVLNKTYALPIDKSEWNRLDLQHIAFYLALGAPYPCPQAVKEVLKPEYGVSKNILDLGCGTGKWAVEIAKEFPHASVVGLDLAPVPLEAESTPPNLSLKVGDINLGLSEFYDQFDLIHMRAVLTGLKDQSKSLNEIQKCLRPGGVLLIYTPDLHQWAADRNSLVPVATENNRSGSWLQRIFHELKQAVLLNGSDITTVEGMFYEGLWDNYEIMDLETCGTGNIWIPNGPWATSTDPDIDSRLKLSGALMRRNLLQLHRSWHGVIKKFGVEAETLEEWAKRIDEEIMTMKFKSWTRIRLVWGRRRAATDKSAPGLPIHDIDSSSSVWSKYEHSNQAGNQVRQVEVDGTREEAAEKARDRLKAINEIRTATLVHAP